MTGKIKYQFAAKVWQHAGYGSWHFVSLPKKLSQEIRLYLRSEEEGWGRLKVNAETGSSQWETAIWFDTKQSTYLLPLKAEIRRKELVEADNDISIVLWI